MLIFTHSTMGGGKSSLLISKYYNAEEIAIPVKAQLGRREENEGISSRNGASIDPSKVLFIGPGENRVSVVDRLVAAMKHQEEITGKRVKVILVDEAQFLSREQVEGLLEISLDNDVSVECFGLLTDFQTNLFEGSKRLVELADSINSITSYGSDGRLAKHNFRTVDGDSVVMVGGDDMYRAVSNYEYFRGGWK